jgi:oxygen-dependent protoporphyrinogen oxidase
MGELIETIERKLPAGSIRYESPVAAIARDGAPGRPGWQVRTAPGDIAADAVILASPAYVAAEILRGVDAEVARRCAEVPYASTASVTLAWPREAVRHPLGGSGFVVARRYNSVRITACTWVSSKWTGRAPAGSVLLRAFVGSAHDPAAVDLGDADMIDAVVRDLAPLLGIAGPPRLASVARWRRAGAQHTVGHIERVAAIDARLAAHGGLFVAGSGFRSVGIPDCIADGRAAAARAAQWANM